MNLNLHNLTINFHGKPFLGPINCLFSSGYLNLVVGASGIGKSTLLKLISGFHKDFSGSVTLDENNFEPEGQVALAFQNPESLFFNSTVKDEISYSLKMSGVNPESIDSLTIGWMEKWGLDSGAYSEKYPFSLSGGEKRRVALAACTIIKPKVILLDEPLAGLDRAGQSDLSSVIRHLSSDHIVVVVTHEPEILLEQNSKILFVNSNESLELNTQEFLVNALTNPDFYPLPDWYVAAVSKYAKRGRLPLVNAKSVSTFLENLNK